MWAPVVFVLCWTVLTPALAPGTLLATTAGLAFGVAEGVAVALAGATAGGVLAFLIARRTAASAVAHLEGERLRRLQERVERRGFLSVAAARAAPGVPTTLLNYACGLSRIRLREFAAGTLVGGAPRIFGYAALGGSGGDLTSPLALVALGTMAAITLSGLGLVVARRRSARGGAVTPSAARRRDDGANLPPAAPTRRGRGPRRVRRACCRSCP